MERGFKDVLPLTGGLDAWRLAGFELKALNDVINAGGNSEAVQEALTAIASKSEVPHVLIS